jgi:hypothetical protein
MVIVPLLRRFNVGFRLFRYKANPWSTLAIAPFKLLFVSSVYCHQEKMRYWKAIAKIDFVKVYQLLNDLLW